MNPKDITIKEIVRQWLEANGYDGLCESEVECGCPLDDFMPCDEPHLKGCVAAHREEANVVGGYLMFPGKKE